MQKDATLRRVTWVALALSLLSAGVGHVYCGRVTKGLLMYFAWLLIPICGFVAALGQPSAAGLFLLLFPPVGVFLVYIYAAVDAWRLAGRLGADYTLRDYNRPWIYWLLVFAHVTSAIGLVAGVRNSVYEAYVIPVNNMSPTILATDRVLARKLLPRSHFPERGDLIVYRNPTPDGGSRFMGRVVAVADDVVALRGEQLIINGEALGREQVADEALSRSGQNMKQRVAYEENSGRRYLVVYGDFVGEPREREDFEMTVPDRHVFVLGDNRDRSKDSRHIGAIQSGDVLGTVEYIYWPARSWSRFGLIDAGMP